MKPNRHKTCPVRTYAKSESPRGTLVTEVKLANYGAYIYDDCYRRSVILILVTDVANHISRVEREISMEKTHPEHSSLNNLIN